MLAVQFCGLPFLGCCGLHFGHFVPVGPIVGLEDAGMATKSDSGKERMLEKALERYGTLGWKEGKGIELHETRLQGLGRLL